MNTNDLSKFGYRELALAGELLSALKTNNDETEYLTDGIKVEFNPNSGNVFLVDDDCNVAMMNRESGKLEDFFTCPQCGHEGFKEEMEHNADDKDCQEYLEQIGVKVGA